MKSSYILSPAAVDDIDLAARSIIEFLGDIAAAEKFIDNIHDALDRLAKNPNLGHRREDLTALPVFFWNVLDRHAVIYRKRQPLEIVRVLPWKREISTLLG